MKRWYIRSFQPILWLLSAVQVLMSKGMCSTLLFFLTYFLSFHLSRFSFILLFVQYRSWNCCYVWVYVNLLKMGIKRDDSSYRWILLPSKYPQPSPCSSCTLSNSSTSRPQWSLGNMLASRSKVRRFKPDWSRRIFPGRKNPEHKSSRRDFKLGVPSLRFQAC